MIVTAGTLEESRDALELVKAHSNLYCTVGVHPTRCSEFFNKEGAGGDPEAHVAALAAVLEKGKALGKVHALLMHFIPLVVHNEYTPATSFTCTHKPCWHVL